MMALISSHVQGRGCSTRKSIGGAVLDLELGGLWRHVFDSGVDVLGSW